VWVWGCIFRYQAGLSMSAQVRRQLCTSSLPPFMPSLVTSPARLVPPSRASALLPLIYPTCFCAPGFSACLVGRWCVSCSCNVGASLSYVVLCHSTEQGCTACTPACPVIHFAHVCICACMYQPPECSASRMGIPWHMCGMGVARRGKEGYEVLLPAQGLSTGAGTLPVSARLPGRKHVGAGC
jgi:hypothetical protein